MFKSLDERIRDQSIATILCVNDTCPDEKFRLAMRSVVMSEIDRMWRRLKELAYDEWRRIDNTQGNRTRRDNRQSEQSQ